MANSEGKVFEGDFRNSCKKQGYWVLRIKDQYYMNTKLGMPSTTNPYDYIVLNDETGDLYCLELKSTCYKSIGFQLTPEDSDSMIHSHQIAGLLEAQQGMKHVHAGFLFQFRELETVYYMDINDFLKFTTEVDRKSITPAYIEQYGGRVIETKKLRTHISINIADIFKEA